MPTEESRLLRQSKQGLLKIIFSRTMLTLILLLINCILLLSAALGILKNVPLPFGGITVYTAVVLLIVLNSRENPSVKLSWCAFIAVLPLPGSVLYFFARFNAGSRLSRKALAQSIGQCAPLLPDSGSVQQHIAKEDTDFYNLSRYFSGCGFPTYPAGHTEYFPLGEEMFQRMLQQIEKAEAYIYLEFFIVCPGVMWGQLLEALHRKAKEGVDVRVLYDGMNALTNLPADYPKQLEKLGISCRVFSPVLPFVSSHYNNRDHRKIMVIDGRIAFTGGVNLQDRYINAEQVFGHWKDCGVMVEGTAAGSFTALFLQLWNIGQKQPQLPPATDPAETANIAGYVIPFGDSPLGRENVGKMVYLNMLNQAKHCVYIMTPYLILDGELLTALEFAAKRGIDVRLILPHIPDKKIAFALAKSHYPQLIEAGVKIYEYTPGFVHAKVFLCDGRQAVVGTINLDYRSLYHHFECGTYLYETNCISHICTDFEATFAKSQLVTRQDLKKQNFFLWFVGKLLKVAAPLL